MHTHCWKGLGARILYTLAGNNEVKLLAVEQNGFILFKLFLILPEVHEQIFLATMHPQKDGRLSLW